MAMTQSSDKSYDAIVIGSGIGGLTAAALLSKINNKKVLLLEKHWTAGGQTHEFRRNDYHWEVGLHYVGDMHTGSLARQIFDYISDEKLDWVKMPRVFEKFVYPDFTFEVPDRETDYIDALLKQFPQQEKNIKYYFSDIHRVVAWTMGNFIKNIVPFWIKPFIVFRNLFFQKLALSTTAQILDKHFTDQKLKALLASQWGDYGLPPQQSAFAIHALIAKHYFNGAWFPRGGGKSIAKSILPVIEARGGECLVNHEVVNILVSKNKVRGVEVKKTRGGKTEKMLIYAPLVISNVGAELTYKKLLPDTVELPFIPALDQFKQSYSAVTLYIGLKESPESLGFRGENYWLNDHYNHDEFMQQSADLLQGNGKACYLSFPSLKNPDASAHTAEIICFIDYRNFEQWRNKPWKNRGKEYDQLKQNIAQAMLNLVEGHYPGFIDLVEYQEVSTPLTIENFTSRDRGKMYGIPAVPARYTQAWLKPETPVKNLYLGGSDVCSLGIVGALMGGVAAVSAANGQLGFFNVMKKIKQDL
jgi:phytoene dehydrogenase-like protein